MLPSPLLNQPGAVPGTDGDPDALVPAHLGEPLREQAALAGGRAVTHLARDVVTVAGPDRLSWLTTLTSQVLTGLVPPAWQEPASDEAAPDDATSGSTVPGHRVPRVGGTEALLMDAQGHLTHALAVADDGERTWLVTEAGDGGALTAFLDSMRFMLRVEVATAPEVAVLGSMGEGLTRLAQAARSLPPAAAPAGCSTGAADAIPGEPTDAAGAAHHGGTDQPDAVDRPAGGDTDRTGRGALLATWRDPWPGVVEGGTSYFIGDPATPGEPGPPTAHPGADYEAGFVLVPLSRLDAVADAFLASGPDRHLAGALAWEALRVEAGRPRQAREVDERTIPHELDWLRTAVHLTKGCYPGQETIARVVNLGRPPRRLTILQLDGSEGDLPLPGATVRLGDKAVGALTTVVRHHELGPMALAVLRRAVPVDAALTAETSDGVRVAAAQEPLVGPEGRAQASPAQRPGAGLSRNLLR